MAVHWIELSGTRGNSLVATEAQENIRTKCLVFAARRLFWSFLPTAANRLPNRVS